MFNKIIEKLVNKYYKDNEERLEKKFEQKWDAYVEQKIVKNCDYLIYKITDNCTKETIKRIIHDIVNERANKFYNNVQDEMGSYPIYEQVEKVMKQRVNEIVQREYRDRITDVVNEVMDKLKEEYI